MRELTLGDVHCEVDTLVNILSLVGHPKGVYLILDKGCVLEAPSTTTTTPQRAVSKPDDNSILSLCVNVVHSLCMISYHYVLQGHGGCVRWLTLGDVHCEVDTLVNILSLVGHPEGVDLTLDKGRVLEAPSTTTTRPQGAVSKPDDNSILSLCVNVLHSLCMI